MLRNCCSGVRVQVPTLLPCGVPYVQLASNRNSSSSSSSSSSCSRDKEQQQSLSITHMHCSFSPSSLRRAGEDVHTGHSSSGCQSVFSFSSGLVVRQLQAVATRRATYHPLHAPQQPSCNPPMFLSLSFSPSLSYTHATKAACRPTGTIKLVGCTLPLAQHRHTTKAPLHIVSPASLAPCYYSRPTLWCSPSLGSSRCLLFPWGAMPSCAHEQNFESLRPRGALPCRKKTAGLSNTICRPPRAVLQSGSCSYIARFWKYTGLRLSGEVDYVELEGSWSQSSCD